MYSFSFEKVFWTFENFGQLENDPSPKQLKLIQIEHDLKKISNDLIQTALQVNFGYPTQCNSTVHKHLKTSSTEINFLAL